MTQSNPILSPSSPDNRPGAGLNSRSSRLSRLLAPALEYGGMLLVLAILIAIFSYQAEHFFSRETFQGIASRIPATVIAAVGTTFILIIAGIDLSVGSILGLAGAVLGVCLVGTHLAPTIAGHTLFAIDIKLALPWAIVAALAVGLLCGILNGAITIRWAIPSFIVTLGMLEIARGATHLLMASQTQYIGSAVSVICEPSLVVGLRKFAFLYYPFLTGWLSGGLEVEDALIANGDMYLVLSLPFVLAVAVVIAGQLTLSRTVFGRYLVAIGTNEEAVRLSGINPRPIKLAVFALSGLLCAVGGIINTARFESADPNAGTGFELEVIAAVVVGGTSLMGGRGSVISSFFGVLIIAVLGTGLAAIGAGNETKRVVTGCVIVAAVILDYYRRRLGSRSGRAA